MSDAWHTYVEAAELLKTTPEGVRQRAIRKRWQRQVGNDGLARVRLPEGWSDAGRTAAERRKANTVRTPNGQGTDASLVSALQTTVDILKQQLAASEARAERLEADFSVRDAQHAAELTAEREKAGRAWVELSRVADALAQLAEANQRRPWWRRLALAG
jgi:hypothetical protein